MKEIADCSSAGRVDADATTFRLPAVQLAVSRAGVPASQIDAYVKQIVEDPRVIKDRDQQGGQVDNGRARREGAEPDQAAHTTGARGARSGCRGGGGGAGDRRSRCDTERGSARRGPERSPRRASRRC